MLPINFERSSYTKVLKSSKVANQNDQQRLQRYDNQLHLPTLKDMKILEDLHHLNTIIKTLKISSSTGEENLTLKNCMIPY